MWVTCHLTGAQRLVQHCVVHYTQAGADMRVQGLLIGGQLPLFVVILEKQLIIMCSVFHPNTQP